MAILNYTTKINAQSTILEIQKILVSHGAKKITIDYDGAVPCAVSFSILLKDRFIQYALPCNYSGVLKAMKNQKVKTRRGATLEDQAVRVSWRIVKDWIESQMALIEANLAELPQVFLPYAKAQDGSTLYEYIKNSDSGIKLLAY